MAVSVVPQWASKLRNELVSALADVPDSRDSGQGISQANVFNYPLLSWGILAEIRFTPILTYEDSNT